MLRVRSGFTLSIALHVGAALLLASLPGLIGERDEPESVVSGPALQVRWVPSEPAPPDRAWHADIDGAVDNRDHSRRELAIEGIEGSGPRPLAARPLPARGPWRTAAPAPPANLTPLTAPRFTAPEVTVDRRADATAPRPRPDASSPVEVTSELQPSPRPTIAGVVPMTQPKRLSRWAPRYPERCQRQGHAGVVELELDVDEGGRVSAARLVEGSGCEELDAAAVAAARELRYAPATVDGTATPAVARLRFRFRLR